MVLPGDFRIFVRTEERGRPVPDASAVQSYFEKFGEVCDVYRPPSQPDICYVTLASEEELQAALAESRITVAGLTCNLQQAVPRGGGRPAGAGGSAAKHTAAPQAPASSYSPPSSHRLYVMGVQDGVDEELMKAYFGYFGTVKDVYIPADRHTGRKRPFAFVTMSSGEELQNILQTPMHHVSEGVSVSVMAAEPREAQGGGKGAGGFPAAATSLYPEAALSPELRPSASHAALSLSALGHQALSMSALGQQALSMSSLGQQDLAPEADEKFGALLLAHTREQRAALGQPSDSAPPPMQGVPGPNRLFVFGMPEGLNADMLRGHFARHGELLDIYVPQRNADIAFVTFSNEEELKDALQNSGLRIAGFWVKGMKAAEQRKGGGKAAGKGAGVHYRPY